MENFKCDECESTTLHINAILVRDVERHLTVTEWQLSCDEGHIWKPVVGDRLTVGPCE